MYPNLSISRIAEFDSCATQFMTVRVEKSESALHLSLLLSIAEVSTFHHPYLLGVTVNFG
jgi:hypothetical protein